MQMYVSGHLAWKCPEERGLRLYLASPSGKLPAVEQRTLRR